MKVLWLDTETTGIDPKKNGIIQAAFIVEIDGQVKEERVFQMCPASVCEINAEALKVNKITEEQIKTYPPEHVVKKEIDAMFEKYVSRYDPNDKFIVAGYNVGFDIDFLSELFSRSGDVYFRSWVDAAKMDIMIVQSFLEWTGKSPKPKIRKLAGLGLHYSAENANSHDALDDIRLTREIGLSMYEMIKGGEK